MTRDQLIEKRRRKKRLRAAAVVGAAAAAVMFPLFVLKPLLNQPKKRHVGTESTTTIEVGDNASDTAVRAVLADERTGTVGWNVTDHGWWFMNDDGTIWTDGWKTIDGQQYWFTDKGYMGTGWINTGGVKDTYFDETGIPDPTKQQKLCALTYDDGPSSNTDKLLDTLERYNAKATFFVVGQQAEYYNTELQREFDLGMEIGNHTWDHPWLNMISADEIESQLSKNDALIAKTTGISKMKLMRPTGGGVSTILLDTITRPMIEWDVDTLDWEHLDAQKTYERIKELTVDGSVILMHDLFAPSADAADQYINYLQSDGFKLVTVSELAEAYGYDLQNGYDYFAFYPGGCDLNKTKEEGYEIAASKNN